MMRTDVSSLEPLISEHIRYIHAQYSPIESLSPLKTMKSTEAAINYAL